MMIGSISQASSRLKSNVRGFTLIELLIALTILGILAAIVIPAYNAQVQSTRRSDAVSALLQSAQDLERCRSDTLAYNAATCTDYSGGVASPRGFYTISSAAADGGQQTATTFTLVATPVGNQANDTQCAQFTLDQAGARAAQDNTATDTTADCWR
ncbi:MAG: type IV pilin protein [Gammaproteobacteria bacterium]|nr:type IV pilin protein [Gammaproteobacteria bacterium]